MSVEHPRDDDVEIDLRKYLEFGLRYWPLILGAAVLAALAWLGFDSTRPRTYEAVAVVANTRPQYVIEFDPRFKTAADAAASAKALVSLALSDEVLSAVATKSPATMTPADRSVDRLREMLTPAANADPTLVDLKVQASDPEQATAIVNVWAEVLVDRAREVYGQGEGDVPYFEARLAEADERLGKLEAELSEFQARNELGVLKAQLAALQRDQLAYLAERSALERLIADVEGYRGQVAKQPADARITPSDDLLSLLLSAKTYNAGSLSVQQSPGTTSEASPFSSSLSGAGSTGISSSPAGGIQLQALDSDPGYPLQLQVSAEGLASGRTAGELQAYLAELAAAARSRSAAVDARLEELAPRAYQLQGQVQRAQSELDRLTLERDVARETYQAIARKTEEARIAAQDVKGQIRVASQALAPGRPADRDTWRNAALVGVLGALFGVVAGLALEVRRRDQRPPAPETAGSGAPSVPAAR